MSTLSHASFLQPHADYSLIEDKFITFYFVRQAFSEKYGFFVDLTKYKKYTKIYSAKFRTEYNRRRKKQKKKSIAQRIISELASGSRGQGAGQRPSP